MNSKACESQVRRKRGLGHARTEIEHRRVVEHRTRDSTAHLGDVDASIEVKTPVEELHFEQGTVVPERARPLKTDVAILLEGELRDSVGQLRRTVSICLAGPILRESLDGRESERWERCAHRGWRSGRRYAR